MTRASSVCASCVPLGACVLQGRSFALFYCDSGSAFTAPSVIARNLVNGEEEHVGQYLPAAVAMHPALKEAHRRVWVFENAAARVVAPGETRRALVFALAKHGRVPDAPEALEAAAAACALGGAGAALVTLEAAAGAGRG